MGFLSKIFGGGGSRARADASPPPMAAAPPAADAAVAIGQQIASVQIGRLPQGGTPAALLITLGASGLGLGGTLLAFAGGRRRERRAEEAS